jgi:hypothetical protein
MAQKSAKPGVQARRIFDGPGALDGPHHRTLHDIFRVRFYRQTATRHADEPRALAEQQRRKSVCSHLVYCGFAGTRQQLHDVPHPHGEQGHAGPHGQPTDGVSADADGFFFGRAFVIRKFSCFEAGSPPPSPVLTWRQMIFLHPARTFASAELEQSALYLIECVRSRG